MIDRRSLLLSASAAALLGGVLPVRSQPKTTLTIGVSATDIGQLDPHRAVGTPDRTAASWIFSGLVRFKPGTIDPAQIEPDLAESWTSNADKTEWTFQLRRGVQFHSGFGELTADDVVFSLRKASNPATSAFSGDFGAFQVIEAVGSHTVRIKLAHAIPSLLGVVTNYSGGFIISRKAYQARGDNFTRNPIGTGPFAVDEIVPKQALNLKSHDAYFRGAPKIKRVIYRFLNANAPRDLAYESGELDVVQGVQDQRWVSRFKGLPNTEVTIFEPGELSQLYLNMESPLLKDLRIRQAIAHAINRDELVRWRGADISRPGLSVIPSGTLGFDADNGLPTFDLAKAKALLAEAGHPNGVTIEIVQTQLPDMLNLMQVVQAQLQRAGIKLELKLVEHSAFHQLIRKDESPIVMYSAARFPVADVYLTQFFASQSIVNTPTAVTNFSHSRSVDAEIEQARTTSNQAEQLRLWHEAQRKLVAEVAAVPLIETLIVWARRKGFSYGFDLKGAMAGGPLITEQSGFI